ncbi:MAG: hypothetical protein JEZ11_03815 [Desulfobacterales bacterium]|nr:hypothetical protein [Desulfobacterales bacterium]
MALINAVNVKTGLVVCYGLSDVTDHRQAAMNAHAQITMGDYHWWDYGNKYPVKETAKGFVCGDWLVKHK